MLWLPVHASRPREPRLRLAVEPRRELGLLSEHLASVGLGLGLAFWISAGPITVPNASFESPQTLFVGLNVDSWQKAPKPDWYVEGGGFEWNQLIGQFKNPAVGQFDHLENCHGAQAVWLFAVPEVAIYQDNTTRDWNDPAPTGEFNVHYEVGHSYRLTVGINGGGGNMLPGVTLRLALYYRDPLGQRIPTGETLLANSSELFPNHTQFTDFSVSIPPVQPGDPWAGLPIGIEFQSTVSPELQGGYWDLDNVRLVSNREPTLLPPVARDARWELPLQGEPGQTLEVLSSPSLETPLASWNSIGTLSNPTGTVSLTIDVPVDGSRFFRVRQVP